MTLYRYDDRIVTIARVIHGSRDIASLLADDPSL